MLREGVRGAALFWNKLELIDSRNFPVPAPTGRNWGGGGGGEGEEGSTDGYSLLLEVLEGS